MEKNNKKAALNHEYLRLLSDKKLFNKRYDEYIEMSNKLALKLFRIMEISPRYGIMKNGKFIFDYDVSTKELISGIIKENKLTLKKQFPDLFYIEEYLKENDITDI